MNILIIGNGFDLAHSLPTRYTDFLKYCRDYCADKPVSGSEKMNLEFLSFTNDNVWLQYFLKSTTNLENPRTWIDFEQEVAEVVNAFVKASPIVEVAYYLNAPSEIILELSNDSDSEKLELFISLISAINKDTQKYVVAKKDVSDTKALIDYIYLQLRLFARAFEIYCLSINRNPVSPDTVITSERKKQIDKATSDREYYSHQAYNASGYVYRKDEQSKFEKQRDEAEGRLSTLISGIKTIDYLSMSKFDCVLSFNYTNTYERLYGNEKTKYCYIHGKAQDDKARSKIILGIDDKLQRGEESRNFTWVKLKKYYQRIIFKTGSEYKDWLASVEKQNANRNYVYIVGHSLDKTDYDVLYDVFSNKCLKIIVYYYCTEDFEDKVQKVIQLLAYKGGNGRDELISRTHGSQKSIEFIDQYDETEGLFIKNEKVILHREEVD